ncbi:MAG: CotH kinase family protein [Flavobacteriales bacterium]|nr:CotH kinase family protein [Flavobacteriales bacterium]
MKHCFAVLFLLSITFNQVNAQTNGTALFDESYVHSIELTFDNPNFWDTLQTHYDEMMGDFFSEGTGIKQYIPASCIIDGNLLDSVGVRQKGNYSNWGAPGDKKPLKLDFNEFISGQKHDGLKKLNLSNGFQDPSMLRDVLSYKMMRDAGIAAPRTSFAKVYLNGTYWGLYVLVEQVNKEFLSNNFNNKNANLFKCIDNTDFLWQGTNPVDYEDEFELKTNEVLNDWT